MEIKGKYNTAIVYNDYVETEAISQIIQLLNQKIFENVNVRIMPDVHAGRGCVIGFTAKCQNKVIPNLIGVDIGCGMYVTKLGNIDLDLPELDKYIRNNIPYGFNKNDKILPNIPEKMKENVKIVTSRLRDKDANTFLKGLGSLGGGNHFIEINKDKEDNLYLVIHSGSRNFGKCICDYHQRIAKEECNGMGIPVDLSYLEGISRNNYIHDQIIARDYASLNRELITNKILSFLDISSLESYHTIHNFIDNDGMVRKGAVCADKDKKLIIPLNMKEGSIIAIGKGNPEWNNSAPHGAGRLMSRGQAKRELDLSKFTEDMKGIYTSCVGASTLDEAPSAYKSSEVILNNINDTVDIIEIIKPIYNFKG